LFAAAFHKLSFLCEAFPSRSLFAVFLLAFFLDFVYAVCFCTCSFYTKIQILLQSVDLCERERERDRFQPALCVLFPSSPCPALAPHLSSATFLFGFEVGRKLDVVLYHVEIVIYPSASVFGCVFAGGGLQQKWVFNYYNCPYVGLFSVGSRALRALYT